MRLPLFSGLAAVCVALAVTLNAGADTAPQSAIVKILDTGFYPASVTIQTGGTVIWRNRGNFVHTAQTLGGPPLPFDTGGFGPNQDVSLVLSLPGVYYYTSETDCLNGNSLPGFVCGGYSV